MVLSNVPLESLEATIAGMAASELTLPAAAILKAVHERRGILEEEAPSEAELRREEYDALCSGREEDSVLQQFVCKPVSPNVSIAPLIELTSEVSRLREVRALTGFTRVIPPADEATETVLAPISAQAPTWLPAVEVLGEGVFLKLPEAQLRRWEDSQFAIERAELVQRAEYLRAGSSIEAIRSVTPRRLLLHSLAHILVTEMSLHAGYPAASLRERLYSSTGQSGILIYTASADSAGSLGGLASLSEADTFSALIRSAVARALWCSADPVCIESTGTGTNALNLAACHACLLLPETSCELFNTYLDRATLVGLPGHHAGAYFASLV